ncbi:MAG: hypothetical protein ACKVS6_01475 [Planctomycetota bacterium]
MLSSILLSYCPLCGAAGNLWLFFIILGTFIFMFAGTLCLFFAAVSRGEWKDPEIRWGAVRAEYSDEDEQN